MPSRGVPAELAIGVVRPAMVRRNRGRCSHCSTQQCTWKGERNAVAQQAVRSELRVGRARQLTPQCLGDKR